MSNYGDTMKVRAVIDAGTLWKSRSEHWRHKGELKD